MCVSGTRTIVIQFSKPLVSCCFGSVSYMHSLGMCPGLHTQLCWMAQAPLSLCFSPIISDSQESSYFLRPQFGTAILTATHVPLAKASHMGKLAKTFYPFQCSARPHGWGRRSEGLETKIQPTIVTLQTQNHRTPTPQTAPAGSAQVLQITGVTLSFSVLKIGWSPIPCPVQGPGDSLRGPQIPQGLRSPDCFCFWFPFPAKFDPSPSYVHSPLLFHSALSLELMFA